MVRNLVLIMTDSQMRSMVGAYGGADADADTPNIDRLAATGVRFDRAYSSSPLCTPARGAIFSGLHPQVNGAWCNNVAPSSQVALMGSAFAAEGFRAAFVGKWHLDGTSYFGDGVAGGGFEAEWWLDGKRWAEQLGLERFVELQRAKTPDDLRRLRIEEQDLWGWKVADRAIEFLQAVRTEERFVLAVSFDEPHHPYLAPPDWWAEWPASRVPPRANLNADLDGKPQLQQQARAEVPDRPWPPPWVGRFYASNAWIDRQVGRVVEAVERLHGGDTAVIYTSDHGEQFGAHGLWAKGPMMYEESTAIPLVIRAPGGTSGAASPEIVSHVDILPTMLELADLPRPPVLHGRSLADVVQGGTSGPASTPAFLSFHRFAINHDSFGGFYPIRCAVDGRYKLAVNLFDTDELYDLEDDPEERVNRIGDRRYADARDRLHDAVLDQMDAIRDPFRMPQWSVREWRSVPERAPKFWGAPTRPRPEGFAFQPSSLGAGE